MPTPTLSELLEQVQDLLDKWLLREEEQRAWLTGSATGGPSGDGYYPLTDPTGYEMLVPSPAKMRVIALSLEPLAIVGAGPHTLTLAHAARRLCVHNNASTAQIVVKVPATPDGVIFFLRQWKGSVLKFQHADGTTPIENRRGHNATAGELAGVSIGAELGRYILDGDTALAA